MIEKARNVGKDDGPEVDDALLGRAKIVIYGRSIGNHSTKPRTPDRFLRKLRRRKDK